MVGTSDRLLSVGDNSRYAIYGTARIPFQSLSIDAHSRVDNGELRRLHLQKGCRRLRDRVVQGRN